MTAAEVSRLSKIAHIENKLAKQLASPSARQETPFGRLERPENTKRICHPRRARTSNTTTKGVRVRTVSPAQPAAA
jgi:hypothetical protein